MPRVKMTDTTRLEGQGYVAGSVVDVPAEFAERLKALGIAEDTSEAVTPPPQAPPAEPTRQERNQALAEDATAALKQRMGLNQPEPGAAGEQPGEYRAAITRADVAALEPEAQPPAEDTGAGGRRRG